MSEQTTHPEDFAVSKDNIAKKRTKNWNKGIEGNQ